MKAFKTYRLSSLFAAIALFTGSGALAGTATSNMSVGASVTDSCSISAGSLDFGAYDPTSASDATSTATLNVFCTNGASANITLGQGSNPDTGSSDAAPLRRMGNGTDYLSYALFQDAGFNTAWGNTAGTGLAYGGTGSSDNLTIYAKMPKNQALASAGTYSDTVTATVSF